MSNYPIVPGSEVSTPIGGVQINGASFREAALAPGKLGEAIGQDVGSLFQGISQQIQEARNTRKVFDADMTMRDTKEQFLNDIQKDPELASDPGKWVPAIQQRVKDTQDKILSQPDLAPVVKRHLEQMAGVWGMSTTSEVRTQALRREQTDNLKSGMEVARRALMDDTDGSGVATAVASYKELNRLGLMDKKQMAQKIEEAPEIAAEAQANNVIATNPENAPKIIERNLEGKMPPLKMRIVQHVALQAQARAQSENQQAISEQIDDNPLHTYDLDALKIARNSNHISPVGYERIVARMKAYATSASIAQNKQEADELAVTKLAADSPPTDEKNLETWAKDIKDQGLNWTNPAHRLALNTYVDGKVSAVRKEGKKEENPVERQMYSLMDEDRLHGGAFIPMAQETVKGGFFTPDTAQSVRFDEGLAKLRDLSADEIKEKFGKSATKSGIIAAEQLNYAKKRETMRNWFEAEAAAGRKPTIEDADAYRQKIEYPDVMHSVAKMATPARRLVKQGGKTYDFTTGEEVK